jgi:hypothetical protein
MTRVVPILLMVLISVYLAGCNDNNLDNEITKEANQLQIQGCLPVRLYQSPQSTTYITYDSRNRILAIERDFNARIFEYDEDDRVVRIEEVDFYVDAEGLELYEYDDQGRLIERYSSYSFEEGGGDTTVTYYEHYQDSILLRMENGFISARYLGLNEFRKPASIIYYDPQIGKVESQSYEYDELGNVIEKDWDTFVRGNIKVFYEYNYELQYIDIDPTPELFSQHEFAISSLKDIGGTFNENYTYEYYYYSEAHLLEVMLIDSTFANPDPSISIDSQYFYSCEEN